jgi:hypothetical protein
MGCYRWQDGVLDRFGFFFFFFWIEWWIGLLWQLPFGCVGVWAVVRLCHVTECRWLVMWWLATDGWDWVFGSRWNLGFDLAGRKEDWDGRQWLCWNGGAVVVMALDQLSSKVVDCTIVMGNNWLDLIPI